MPNPKKHFKFIVFDLKTEEVRKNFRSDGKYQWDTRPAYNAIKRYMIKRGFEHRQKSAYFSTTRMSTADMLVFRRALFNDIKWLEACTSKMDVTDRPKDHDMFAAHLAEKSARELAEKKQQQNQPPTARTGYAIHRTIGGTFTVSANDIPEPKEYKFSDGKETLAKLCDDWGMTQEQAEHIFAKAESQNAVEDAVKKNSISLNELNLQKQQDLTTEQNITPPTQQRW